MGYLSLFFSFLGALLIFSIVVFIHELGHYLAAKKFGVGVQEFAVGFGKCLFKFQSKETLWKINLVPLGGYVLIKGMVEDDESKNNNDKPKNKTQERGKSFNEISLFKKVFILFAGPLANVVLAFFAFVVIAFLYGEPKRLITIDEVIDNEFITGIAPKGSTVRAVATESRLIEAVEWPDEKDFFSKVEEARFDSERIRIDLDWMGQTLGPIYYEPQVGKSAISFRVEPQIDSIFLDPDRGSVEVLNVAGLELAKVPLTQSIFDLIVSDEARVVMKDRTVLQVKRSDLEDYLGDPLVVEKVFSIDGEKSFEDISAISSSKIQMSYIELETGRNYWTDFERSELLKHFSFKAKTKKVEGLNAVSTAMSNTSFAIAQIFNFVGGVFRFEKKAFDNVGGPVAILSISSEVVRQGLESAMSFLALLSINLGLLNLCLVFFPNLDGGRIVIEISESFVPKSKKKIFREKITKSLLTVGGYALIILFLVVTIRDLTRLIPS